jgi:hypothetical protein
MTTTIDLPLDNNYEPRWSLKQHKTTDATLEPATGLTLTAAFVAVSTDGLSSPIHSDLSLSVTERSGKPGSYFVVFPGTALRARLASYVNRTIYLLIGNGTSVLAVIAHKVKAIRQL